MEKNGGENYVKYVLNIAILVMIGNLLMIKGNYLKSITKLIASSFSA